MSQNFTNFASKDNTQLTDAQLVGYNTNSNTEFRATAVSVVNGLPSGEIRVGSSNTTAGMYAHAVAMGWGNYAGSVNGSAVGCNNTVSNYFNESSAVGFRNVVHSTTWSYPTYLSGGSAFGHSNTVGSPYSSAFGHGNTSSGYYTSTFGYNNTASAYRSTAIGYKNSIADGQKGCAFGYKNTVHGENAAVFGYNNTVSNGYGNIPQLNVTAVGCSNTMSAKYFDNATVVGYGNTMTSSNYDTCDNATIVGSINTINGSGNTSTVVGCNNQLLGTNSTVIGGFNQIASGNVSSQIFGWENSVSANESVVVGMAVNIGPAPFRVMEFGRHNSTNSRSSIRIHQTGTVAMTVPTLSALTDGGAIVGNEIDGTLMRGGLAFRIDVSSGNLIAEYNNAGTIRTWDLGAGV